MVKNEEVGKKFFGLQNGVIKRLQIWAGFRDYKLGKEGLEIKQTLGISNRGKKITNWGKRDFKSGQ